MTLVDGFITACVFVVALIFGLVAVGCSIICCNFMTSQIDSYFCCFVYLHVFILTLFCCINTLPCSHWVVSIAAVPHQHHSTATPSTLFGCICVVIRYALLSCLTREFSPCLLLLGSSIIIK